ncbi:amino-acid N-acetyltransferase [Streptomyces sp. KhCrAH-43]|uniref:GNAT family N-acetyltransferase n=1 Tax=unclassified Streptomyces TaxID=2593676 RepID=UPI00037E25AA|nr:MULTISPECIES: GNAT family N-acetyltransferase [unclassified Streptomyces]MYS37294.1 GNAT family N-acetyltransferase [Streptomyces sp. SID4920]MYX68143.1 GNAT family N-acetyltransferase [Streptomyces sp. SID8373]RAJ56683.1 amino-acid N-acetyltransferase [Streptomyces sp. KhCrAH-43]
MTTAAPRPVPLPVPSLQRAPRVRTAASGDAAALAELSRPFARSGALRERPDSLYAARAAEFLVVPGGDGALEGCVGLRVYAGEEASVGAPEAPVGVLYNFCVAGHRQGCGTGAALLRTALAVARTQSLGALFTATTGDGRLFRRYGFAPATARQAPRAWAGSLDPRRNALILTRTP